MQQLRQIPRSITDLDDRQLIDAWWAYARFLAVVYAPRLRCMEAEMARRGIPRPDQENTGG